MSQIKQGEKIPRTVVEVVDVGNPRDPLLHVTREVRVNGVPVLVAEDGFWIDYKFGEPTKVHLELLPSEIRFNTRPPYEGGTHDETNRLHDEDQP